jgi:hypothetical protein
MYSPYESLKIFFALSITFIDPFGKTMPTSPVASHPLTKASLVFSSFL